MERGRRDHGGLLVHGVVVVVVIVGVAMAGHVKEGDGGFVGGGDVGKGIQDGG